MRQPRSFDAFWVRGSTSVEAHDNNVQIATGASQTQYGSTTRENDLPVRVRRKMLEEGVIDRHPHSCFGGRGAW